MTPIFQVVAETSLPARQERIASSACLSPRSRRSGWSSRPTGSSPVDDPVGRGHHGRQPVDDRPRDRRANTRHRAGQRSGLLRARRGAPQRDTGDPGHDDHRRGTGGVGPHGAGRDAGRVRVERGQRAPFPFRFTAIPRSETLCHQVAVGHEMVVLGRRCPRTTVAWGRTEGCRR